MGFAIGLELINGMSLGVEYEPRDEEGPPALVVHLLIVRLIIFLEAFNG
jgi:hypothetical protein